MKFQIPTGWHTRHFSFDAGTIVDWTKNRPKDVALPCDAVALDLDAAVTMATAYPSHQQRLLRHLSDEDEKAFQRLLPTLPP